MIQFHQIQFGLSFNVIPDVAVIKGVLYSQDVSSGDIVWNKIKEISSVSFIFENYRVLSTIDNSQEYSLIQNIIASKYKEDNSYQINLVNLIDYYYSN